MREVFAIARRARARGNRPFGALLVGGNGAILSAAENSQITDEQVLAHAEMNLLQRAVRDFTPDVLAGSTLYTNAEELIRAGGEQGPVLRHDPRHPATATSRSRSRWSHEPA